MGDGRPRWWQGWCERNEPGSAEHGLAWFETPPPCAFEARLRTGGLPLMEPRSVWPECGRCDAPMLFRAQLPLTSTCLVPFDDERLVVVFECHARASCPEGAALIAAQPLEPRQPPRAGASPVVLAHQSGGSLIPFDDGPGGPLPLPLPTLAALKEEGRVRAVLGPGTESSAGACPCGHPIRLAARLLEDVSGDGVRLAPSRVYVCLTCDDARVDREL